MFRIRSAFALLAACSLGFALAGCGSDSSADACIPGETAACFGPGQCAGAYICLPQGSGFGPCDCGAPKNDAGHTPDDAGHTPDDAGHTPDDAGHTPDDAGHTPDDAGHTPDDAGHTPDDAGTDAGPQPTSCLYPASYDFITELPPRPSSAPPSVPYLGFWVEPDFGTTVRRMSTVAQFGEGSSARHGYSRRPAYNADGSIMIIGNRYVDVASGQILGQHPFSKARWSAIDPDVHYGIRGGDGDLYRYEPSTEEMTKIWDFERGSSIGTNKGNFSNDDRYVVIHSGNTLYSLDIGDQTVQGGTPNPTVLGTLPVPSSYNWASFSQLGHYILLQQDDVGILRYDPDFTNPVQIAWKGNEITGMPRSTHGDLALDDEGRDVYAMISWDFFSYIVLEDRTYVQLGVTNAVEPNYAGHGHVSGRAYQRPGWIYSSTNDLGGGRVLAVRLGQQPGAATRTGTYGETVHPGVAEVEQYGFHFSSLLNYDTQPKAVPNPCGTSVLVNSDMHGEINAYEFAYPQ